MSARSAMRKQFGFAEEVTYGTALAPTQFLPLVDESMDRSEAFTQSDDAVYAGRMVMLAEQWGPGRINVGGDIQTKLWDKDLEVLFRHMFGARTGTGPWTFTPAHVDGQSLTLQIGRPGALGTVHPYNYAGCKISSWEVACAEGEIATLGLTLLGREELVLPALGAAAFTSGLRPYTFVGATVTVGGVAVRCKQLSITGSRTFAEQRFTGSALTEEPLEEGLISIGGQITARFQDRTQYDLFVNRTSTAIVATFSNGAGGSIVFTMNARLDGTTPKAAGRAVLEQPLPFTCHATPGGADSTACSVVITE